MARGRKNKSKHSDEEYTGDNDTEGSGSQTKRRKTTDDGSDGSTEEDSACDSESNVPGEKYKCDQCPDTFNTKSSLRGHKNSYHGAEVNCAACDKHFTAKRYLKRHFQRQTCVGMEEDDPLYENGCKCPAGVSSCEFRIQEKEAMIQHLKSVHPNFNATPYINRKIENNKPKRRRRKTHHTIPKPTIGNTDVKPEKKTEVQPHTSSSTSIDMKPSVHSFLFGSRLEQAVQFLGKGSTIRPMEKVCLTNDVDFVGMYTITISEMNVVREFSSFIAWLHHVADLKESAGVLVALPRWSNEAYTHLQNKIKYTMVEAVYRQTKSNGTEGGDDVFIIDETNLQEERLASKVRTIPAFDDDITMTPPTKQWDDPMLEEMAFSSPMLDEDIKIAIGEYKTLFDPLVDTWDLANLRNDLNKTGADLLFWKPDPVNSKVRNPFKQNGYNVPVLRMGQWKSVIPLQCANENLGLVSFMHVGGARIVFAIPPRYSSKVKAVMQETFPSEFAKCTAFLRHKKVFIKPSFLDKHGIPFSKAIQKEGEYLIIQAGSFFFGVDLDFNITETVLYHTAETFTQFKMNNYTCCCEKKTFILQKELAVKLYQPDKLRKFQNGKDYDYIPYSNPPTTTQVMNDAASLDFCNREYMKKLSSSHETVSAFGWAGDEDEQDLDLILSTNTLQPTGGLVITKNELNTGSGGAIIEPSQQQKQANDGAVRVESTSDIPAKEPQVNEVDIGPENILSQIKVDRDEEMAGDDLQKRDGFEEEGEEEKNGRGANVPLIVSGVKDRNSSSKRETDAGVQNSSDEETEISGDDESSQEEETKGKANIRDTEGDAKMDDQDEEASETDSEQDDETSEKQSTEEDETDSDVNSQTNKNQVGKGRRVPKPRQQRKRTGKALTVLEPSPVPLRISQRLASKVNSAPAPTASPEETKKCQSSKSVTTLQAIQKEPRPKNARPSKSDTVLDSEEVRVSLTKRFKQTEVNKKKTWQGNKKQGTPLPQADVSSSDKE